MPPKRNRLRGQLPGAPPADGPAQAGSGAQPHPADAPAHDGAAMAQIRVQGQGDAQPVPGPEQGAPGGLAMGQGRGEGPDYDAEDGLLEEDQEGEVHVEQRFGLHEAQLLQRLRAARGARLVFQGPSEASAGMVQPVTWPP